LPGGKNYYVIILDDSKADMPVKDIFGPYTAKKSSKLIGHRGGVVDSSYTENSMPALEAAVKRGYYMVEIDVRLTKDSQLIAQHDPTFYKYYHVNRNTQQLGWDSVRLLRSDRDNSRVLHFEEVLQFCKGKLQIMLDNKIIGNDIASFRRIEALMRKYDLLDKALIIGTSETRQYFTGKAKVGYNLNALKKMQQSAGFKPELYFLFDHGNVLTEEAVNWAHQNNILVVPSINKFHYVNIPYMQGADRDITQLKKWGVEFYQVDSEFDQWLR
jgi:glycerophosphoryl diester phosphodiesterase